MKSEAQQARNASPETFQQSFAKVQPSTASSDEDLLRGIVRRDDQALALLFDRYAGVAGGVALRVLRDGEVADEVTEAVFQRVWRDAEVLLKAKTSIAGWLALVARDFAIAALHRTAAQEWPTPVTRNGDGGKPLSTLAVRAREVLAAMEPTMRGPLLVAFFDGLQPDELAALNAKPAREVLQGIRAALLQLRRGVQP